MKKYLAISGGSQLPVAEVVAFPEPSAPPFEEVVAVVVGPIDSNLRLLEAMRHQRPLSTEKTYQLALLHEQKGDALAAQRDIDRAGNSYRDALVVCSMLAQSAQQGDVFGRKAALVAIDIELKSAVNDHGAAAYSPGQLSEMAFSAGQKVNPLFFAWGIGDTFDSRWSEDTKHLFVFGRLLQARINQRYGINRSANADMLNDILSSLLRSDTGERTQSESRRLMVNVVETIQLIVATRPHTTPENRRQFDALRPQLLRLFKERALDDPDHSGEVRELCRPLFAALFPAPDRYGDALLDALSPQSPPSCCILS